MKKHLTVTSNARKKKVRIPKSFVFGEDIKWDAPWNDVNVWVELPFWLMVDNAAVVVPVEGHKFPLFIHDNYFELYAAVLNDSRANVCYRGPLKQLDDLSKDIQQFRKENPDVPLMWRKCKTVVKIATRCNQDVWKKAIKACGEHSRSVSCYLAELCKAHIPVLNKLIQGYRLGTYDYFACEVAPWDVPQWLIERRGQSVPSFLLPYREWDSKPVLVNSHNRTQERYQLIDAQTLDSVISATATPGEYELMDALNLMERGDYSGAVRRVTTAIEVIVEHAVGSAIEAKEDKTAADKYLADTQMNINKRVVKYQEMTGRTLSDWQRQEISETRKMRHRIVHNGYRISQGERGRAQRSIDTGRWLFNWFENNEARQKVREERIALRSLGRDMTDGIFPSRIEADGVVVASSIRDSANMASS